MLAESQALLAMLAGSQALLGLFGGACAPGATLAKPDGCWGVRG